MASELYKKLFLGPCYFTIAIRKKQTESVVQSKQFAAAYTVPATHTSWCADPMLIDHGDKTYLFYEAVNDWHGHIEVAEVNADGTLSAPTVILQCECHYSYPFVFEREGEYYMIPESSAANEVRLYKAKEFPYAWEQVTVLLREKAVDTTVFEHDGRAYLLTYIPDGRTERVTPKAFEMDFGEDISLRPLAWVEYDELRVRGAGGTIRDGGKLYRPAQISTEIRYGDALAFYEIALSDNAYSEKLIDELTAEDISADKAYYDGLHTYSASERFEAIDIRCRDFDLLKTPRRIFRALK